MRGVDPHMQSTRENHPGVPDRRARRGAAAARAKQADDDARGAVASHAGHAGAAAKGLSAAQDRSATSITSAPKCRRPSSSRRRRGTSSSTPTSRRRSRCSARRWRNWVPVRRHQDRPRQPRPRRSHGRRCARQGTDRRTGHGDGAGRAGARTHAARAARRIRSIGCCTTATKCRSAARRSSPVSPPGIPRRHDLD